MPKTKFEHWRDKIKAHVLANGRITLSELEGVLGEHVHPNYGLQILALIALLEPETFAYEKGVLRLKRRPVERGDGDEL